MSQQQVLVVTSVALFENVNGLTTEKGNCACAIVGFPTSPPKFSLVCYNDKRETLCIATITASNEHSLQFSFSTNDYATFSDDKARKWSVMFLKSTEVPKFVACIGAAIYAAAGSPSHQAIVGDLAVAAKANQRLDLSQRCKVHYHAFALNRAGAVPLVDRLLETNGDRAYNFHPVQSAGAMAPEGKGFESSVLGMIEEGRRVVVVPPTMHRAGRSPFGENITVVFVVELVRIIPDGDGGSSGAVADVPLVFGGGGAGQLALVSSNGTSSSTALALVPAAAAAASGGGGGSESSPRLDERPPEKGAAGAVGAGIPAEHMGMIQNAAAKINNATTSARDLHDKIVAFQDDWKQTINRPKPSVLTNEALEQNVKSLVMEHDRLKDEIARRDELIRSLDERNRDLQKRVDRAAMVAQQLMDEKQQTASSASDTRLEKDRAIMKLQEQITRESSERDDIQRHLATVKKLLDVSDAELRDTKGRAEVLKVQAASIAGKLDAIEDQLSEERSRRKALEAKAAALQDEIRNCETDVHMKSAEFEELLRKADAERMHYAQLMEDERQRRAFEAQQLRAEIISELQQREDKFQADRARVAEDNFARGHDEGKEIGRRNARIDVEARVQELQLEAQRAKTALDAYKTELREKNDEAMAENRRLEAIVSTLKVSAEEAARAKAANEYKLHGIQARVRSAEDSLFVAFTNAVHRLTRPAPAENLLQLLTAVRDAQPLKFDFLAEQHAAEAQRCLADRLAWISDDAERTYAQQLAASFESEFVAPLAAGLEQTRAAVRVLWEERDRAMFGSIFDEQTAQRAAAEAEEQVEFDAIERLLADTIAAQQAVAAAESEQRAPIAADETASFEALVAAAAREVAERDAVRSEEAAARSAIAAGEEDPEYRALLAAFEAVVYEKIIAEQAEVLEAEAAGRSDVEGEEATQRGEALDGQFAEGLLAARAQQEEREAAEAQREAQRAAERAELEAAEAATRASLAAEEDGERTEAATLELADRPPEPVKPAPVAEQPTAAEAEAAAAPAPAAAAPSTFAADSDDDNPLAPRPKAASQPKAPVRAAGSDSDEGSAAPRPKPAPKPKKAAFGGSDSDSDDAAAKASPLGNRPAAAAAAAPPKKAPGAKTSAAGGAATLFNSGSDSEGERPAPKPAAPKKAPGKKTAAAKMFESDSD